MKMLRMFDLKLKLATVLFCSVLIISIHAGQLVVGDTVPTFSAKDQFGKEFKLTPGLRYLLLGLDMSTGKEANHKLAELGAGWLEKRGAAYVLDIHTMPEVARIFAFPKMRKYPEKIVLADKAGLLDPFPRQPERITVMVLTATGQIHEIRYWNPVTEELSLILKAGNHRIWQACRGRFTTG
jgi:hypothetical protein